MLRRARERRGLTLERVARETKIPQRHLEALEHDNLGVIPSGFYRRAELRTYAQAVGLDQRVALAELESAQAAPSEPQETRQRTASSTSPLPYIAMAVAVIAVIAAIFGRAGIEDTSQPTPSGVIDSGATSAPQPAAVSAEPEPTLDAVTPDAITPGAVTPEVATPAAAAQVALDPTQVPAPAGSLTELVVTTEPEGARITVNGIGWGSSPARIPYLEPGQKRIRVSKEGYVAVERLLQVEQGRRQALNIRLEPAQ
jgi:cytoskeletal protein RodZ